MTTISPLTALASGITECRWREDAAFTKPQTGASCNNIANLVDSIGTPDFFKALLDWIQRCEDHSCAFIALHKPQLKKPKIFVDIDSDPINEALSNYRRRTYRINPFYWHHLGCTESGIVLASELPGYSLKTLKKMVDKGAPITPDSSAVFNYRTIGWPKGLDELSLYVKVPDAGTLHVALMRDTAFEAGTGSGIALMKSWMPAVESAVRCHLAISEQTPETEYPILKTAALTPRQLEIFRWWAAGKTLDEIATIVGIKRRTVRYHMERVRDSYGYSTVQQAGVRIARDHNLDPLGVAWWE